MAINCFHFPVLLIFGISWHELVLYSASRKINLIRFNKTHFPFMSSADESVLVASYLRNPWALCESKLNS